MKKVYTFLALTFIALSMNAQDIAMITTTYNNNLESNKSNYVVTPLITKTTYTYKYKGDDVLVVFTGDEHIEFFNNKKYFIKSNIEWTANDECYMTIKEANLPNFPFKSGTKLHMKITKIKRGYIFYESTLGGRSWTGKMKKLN